MLSPTAQKIVANYLSLPFEHTPGVVCPYYNNKKTELHGGLRAQIGKGSPDDIAEEALIASLHEKRDLAKMNAEELKKFLVDHRIGVDCSAFVYYVLKAEVKARGKGNLKKLIRFPYITNPLRKLLVKLRTVENVDVKTLVHDMNSQTIALGDVEAGDMIALLGGRDGRRDHILVITDVQKKNSVPTTLSYAHSDEWPSDGRYGHGVRTGTMTIIDSNKSILEQIWNESTTYNAQELVKQAGYKPEIRRLKWL